MSFEKCPSCEKTVFVKDSGQCPHCGVILEAEAAAQPQASGDNRDTEFPQRSKMSCLVAGMAAAIAIVGAAVFIMLAARG